MMAALLLSADWPTMPRRILQIGLGAGSLTRFIYRYLPDTAQVVIEQSAAVVAAARQGFHLPPESERLQIIVAHERTSRSGPDYLPQLKQDILDVIRKYVQIDPEQVTVQLDKKGEELSVLELNIMLADDKKTDTENGEESKN